MSVKALGRHLATELRSPLAPNASNHEKAAREVQQRWCDHIAGAKSLEQEETAIAQGEITQEMLDEWSNTVSGFTSLHVKRKHWKTNELELFDLDDYQSQLLDNETKYAFYKKGRRIGLSMACAVRGLVKAHIHDVCNSFFVSKNNDDAKEKIAYAVDMYHTMPEDIKKDLASHSQKSRLELLSRNTKEVSALKSHPQTEPRGIEGDIYLDEFACYMDQQAIYTAATNAISRVGRVWIVSTPRKKGDLFYQIDQGEKMRKPFSNSRYSLPWWVSRIMVKDGDVATSIKECPKLATNDRVYQYGSQNLIDVYEGNVTEADFQVEYECEYSDDANSLYTDEIMNKALFPLVDKDYEGDLDDGSGKKYEFPMHEKMKSHGISDVFCHSIDEIVHAVDNGLISKNFVMAVDPGFKDGCSIIIAEELPGPFAIIRFNLKLIGVSYYKRENYILKIGQKLPIRRIGIDCRDGEGVALASKLQNAANFGHHKVSCIQATAQLNNIMAIDVRRRMELQLLAIPDYDPLKKDIKKVKRDFTSNGEPTIVVARDKDGHGDRFYSLMYLASLLEPIDGASSKMEIPDAAGAGVPGRMFAPAPKDIIADYHKILSGKKQIKNPMISDFVDIRVGGSFDISGLPKP